MQMGWTSSVALNDTGPVASEHTAVTYGEGYRPLLTPPASALGSSLDTAVPFQ